MRRVLLTLPLVLVLAGCVSSPLDLSDARPVETGSPTPSTDPAPPVSECVEVSQFTLDGIAQGVSGVQESNSLSRGAAAVASDREKVWFIAAEITGPGIEAGQAIGLWASNSDPSDELQDGLTFSVNAFALEFSDWADGTSIEAELSPTEPGAADAIACLG